MGIRRVRVGRPSQAHTRVLTGHQGCAGVLTNGTRGGNGLAWYVIALVRVQRALHGGYATVNTRSAVLKVLEGDVSTRGDSHRRRHGCSPAPTAARAVGPAKSSCAVSGGASSTPRAPLPCDSICYAVSTLRGLGEYAESTPAGAARPDLDAEVAGAAARAALAQRLVREKAEQPEPAQGATRIS
jgi:hypothetical protein